jgi:rhodanese-related sulfurtransferase
VFVNANVDPATLKGMLNDGEELALLDVREEGAFGAGHLLFASSLPLSRLELRIRDLVPRKKARIALCDDGCGLAERAAARLRDLGYDRVAVLDGGVKAWRAAGYILFAGVNVPSKAFGELVEQKCGTPHLTAAELKAKLDAGEDVVVLDSRPLREYRNMCIPGGIDVPGAELVYRVHDIAPSPRTKIVVNCAGRTRSIIGAQSLINAGIGNPVAALENGTMGWHLAGFELERGAERLPPEPSGAGLAEARAAAQRVAERVPVPTIDRAQLEQWRGEAETRSLYMLDVRSPEEFEAGHLPGARSAPGGQLVQETEAYLGTRGSRVVLIDDTGVRAIMTASWLIQMGWREVAVLEGGLDGSDLEQGSRTPEVPSLDDIVVESISAGELAGALENGAASVVDLALSRNYWAGHIPGAYFAIRSRLAVGLARLPPAESLVLTSEDGVLAHFAAGDAEPLVKGTVKVLRGGTEAWRQAGLPLAAGLENMLDEADDIYLRPYDRDFGVEAAMQDYLTWEVGLVGQVAADGDARFAIID